MELRWSNSCSISRMKSVHHGRHQPPVVLLPVFDWEPDVVVSLSAMVSRINASRSAAWPICTNPGGINNVLQLTKCGGGHLVFERRRDMAERAYAHAMRHHTIDRRRACLLASLDDVRGGMNRGRINVGARGWRANRHHRAKPLGIRLRFWSQSRLAPALSLVSGTVRSRQPNPILRSS